MKSFGFLLVVLSSLGSFAATLRVPQDFPTVQGAVAASISGDAIAVSPGLYAIPASACSLANGSQSTCGLVLHDGTALVGSGPAQTVLDFSGAQIGILLQNGTATIKLFHLRSASTDIFAYLGSNITVNNVILTDPVGPSVIGMELNQGNSYIIHNNTIDNIHQSSDPGAVAIDVPFGGVADIQNNVVTNNNRGLAAAAFSSGNYVFNDVVGSLDFNWGQCTSAGCTAVSAPANNISADPLYCPDFTLQPSSPARHAGNPAILNPDGTRSDIGAYGGPEAILPSTICGGSLPSRILVVLFKGFNFPDFVNGIPLPNFSFDGMDILLQKLNAAFGTRTLRGNVFDALRTEMTHLPAQQFILSQGPRAQDKIVIVGHSHGGNRARLFASQLLSVGIHVNALVTVDPIDWDLCNDDTFAPPPTHLADCAQSALVRPFDSRVQSVRDFIQEEGLRLPLLGLVPMTGYNLGGIVSTLVPNTTHSQIDNDSRVHSQIISLIASLP